MRRIAGVIALAATVLLTGCAGAGIAELDREQLASDKLDLPPRYDESGFDGGSTRWLAEHDGVDFPTVSLYIDGPPPMVTKSMIELTPNLYVMEYVPE